MGPFEALYWHKKIIEAYAGRCLNIFLSWLKVTLSDSTKLFLTKMRSYEMYHLPTAYATNLQ